MKTFAPAEKLSDVRERIGEILAYFRETASPLGYFAALYTKVAHGIEEAVNKGEFDDNERLARLDVNFVNYYIRAMNDAVSGAPAPAHWQISIDAAKTPLIPVLDHLFLAMNAHINYDLSNAVKDSVEPGEMIAFKNDFLKVNQILFSLLDDVQNDVSGFFHPLKWYLRFGRQADDKIIAFIMKLMRNDAYGYACILSLCDEAQRNNENDGRMQEVVLTSEKFVHPKQWWLRVAIHLVGRLETGTVKTRIDQLLK
jgi:hypothetical protein